MVIFGRFSQSMAGQVLCCGALLVLLHAEPAVFAPGTISTEKEEYRLVFTPNGESAYFARGDQFFPTSRRATIMVSHARNGAWSAPVVASFSGTHSDIDPFITSDGTKLFFSSIRPVNGTPRTDSDLWMVVRAATGWGEPIHIGGVVNSPSDELYPSVSDDGTLYFASDRPGGVGGWDIYRSRLVNGAYAAPENLGSAINAAIWEFNPAISADGRRLVFTSLNRPGGHGLGDLYVTYFHQGQWTRAENIGPPVNTPADEYHPSFGPKDQRLYFVRHTYTPWVPGDIYEIEVSKLGNRLR